MRNALSASRRVENLVTLKFYVRTLEFDPTEIHSSWNRCVYKVAYYSTRYTSFWFARNYLAYGQQLLQNLPVTLLSNWTRIVYKTQQHDQLHINK